ncbi:hypothetical protein LOTGIDRAFT_235843 [Lottia gigantea]|uniref:Uncharacterized protein n=1 Tax=Lottia gigantea TaxID=225164 RepID=V3ZLI6_LOTGI|nr:hypothetical protein LOTGIDRAFT_235843 [Lottia gigantea]ESO85157.1 hypothetical protein LOTGIDRAFT_235843 [Lottia gigantea]
MASKLILVLALVPLSMAYPPDHHDAEKEQYMAWKEKMEKEKQEYMAWKDKQMDEHKDQFMEWKEKHDDMVDEFKDWKEDKHDEMKKKFMEWKEKQDAMKEKFMEYQHKEKEQQKKEFMEWKNKMEQKSMKDGEDMKHMDDDRMKMIKKWHMWEEKMQGLEHFDKMMVEFKGKAHKFVMKVVHQMLEFCNSAETSDAMKGMLGNAGMQGDNGDKMGMDGSSMPSDMHFPTNMDSEEEMKALAEKVRKMSEENQKKLYIGGMIKSMCTGAKTYALHAYEWKKKYLLH